MWTRVKLIAAGILLCVALGLTVFFAVETVHALQSFQHSRFQAQSGDVTTIRPWMTIPFISHVYHVPEPYLLTSLNVSDARSVRHVTLYALALREHRSPSFLVREVQAAILNYRSQHPPLTPTPTYYTAIPPPVGRDRA